MNSNRIVERIIRIFRLIVLFYFLFAQYSFAVDPYQAEVGGERASGEKIKAIEVRGLTRIKDEELIDLICFGIGDRLDLQELSKGIRRAYKKGIFHDIQVLSEPYEGGVKLIYVVKETPLVKKITIDGNEHFSGKTIKKIFYFKVGEHYREELLDNARQSLLDFYGRKGYPDARINISVENEDEQPMVIIHINIEEGLPLIIEKINVAAEARNIIEAAEGGIFDMDEIDKDIKKIKEYYRKKDYINAVAGPFQFTKGELTIPVYPGTRLEVEFKNNNALSAKELKQELSFIEYEEVTDESIAETAERIKRLYVGKGYYYAQIAAGVDRRDDILKVTFIISEGEKVILRNIIFSGISISPAALKEVIPMDVNKPYNKNLLDDSRESLIRFYNALGYVDVKVVEVKEEFRENGKEVYLEFVITEGLQTKIESIEIVGNERIDMPRILNELNLKEGSPYNEIDIGDARRRVLSLYYRYGYLDANVEVKSIIDKEKAFLTFRITENKPSVIGKIILRGNDKTRAKIVNREFSFHEGDLYNREALTETRQRLYKLGLFNEVSIDVLEPGVEKNDAIVKDMLVSLREGKAGSVEITLGYGDYERARGSLDVRYRNLGGYNRQIGLRSELSSVEKRYIFNFREPWLFNWPNVPLKIYLIREDRRAINIETRDVLYKLDKQSFIAGIEKEITDGLKVGVDYEYSFTDTKDVQEDVILSKEDTGTLGIGSISPSLFYDSRDDPFNPTSGSLQGVVIKYASRAFLSETEFIKGTFQSSWYFQLLKPVVFALSLRGGAAYGFEETEEIPLIERFFLGGRSTVRGYTNDTLGPKGVDDNPTGGNVFALTNWELRFALGKGFGLVTFIDAGNVWRTVGDVEDELKYTAGAGLRYNTPVGPVRIDYGHKMNKEEGESSGEVHFSFGHAF